MQLFDEVALLSRLQQGLKTRKTRFALTLKVILLDGAMAFSSAAHTEGILKEGITPATDTGQIPASAKLWKDTVIAGIPESQGILNPYLFVNGWNKNVTSAIFPRLIDWGSQGKLVPGLTESQTVGPDSKVHTIKSRSGLTFSDGSPLTAEDVTFTLTILLDPKYGGGIDIILVDIIGGADYKAGKADSVDGPKVIDPLTLRVTTTQPGATALAKIGGPVLSKTWYGRGYQWGNLDYLHSLHGKPLGNGPYVCDRYIPDREIRFRANSHSYRGTPPTPCFTYHVTSPSTNPQLLQIGGTDHDTFISRPDDIKQLRMLGFANASLYGSSDYSQVEFNVHCPALQDKRVRQALTYGLDRQRLIDVVHQGYGKVVIELTTPIPWAFNAEGVNPYPYDPTQAEKLLDGAGWKPGADGVRAKDGQRLELTLLTSKKVLNNALIPTVKEDWWQTGVLLKPQVVDFNALMMQHKAGNYDLVSFSISTLNDPHGEIWDFYGSEARRSGYYNAEADELANAGNAVFGIEQRRSIYHQLYKVLTDGPPVILFSYRNILSASSTRASGFKPDICNSLTGSLPGVKTIK